MPRLILASGSPRRKDVLEGLGFELTVRPAEIDETVLDGESPSDYVLRLARAKADAEAHPGELVIAADTAVVIDERILGKPADPTDAGRMLRLLAGREHHVLTGLALADPGRGRCLAAAEDTRVRFKPLGAEEIDWYVATGEPLDKAGAYGVQGLGALFVEAVFGSYSNVVGLPIATLYRLLRQAGYSFPNLPPLPADEEVS